MTGDRGEVPNARSGNGDTMEKKRKCTMILLAAGSGSRMKSKVAKQYMLLGKRPVIWYSLEAAERSQVIDRCILVVGAEDLAYAREEMVDRYGFSKVEQIVAGGAQRYDSVCNALQALGEETDGELIYIHDGARPFLTEEMIRRAYEDAARYGACAVGMPVKDTIKIADQDGFAKTTPDRKLVWQIQTPQVFARTLITEAYTKMNQSRDRIREQGIQITDDAMVVETFSEVSVKLTEGSYENMKITTPEDIAVAEAILRRSARS